MKFAPKFSRLRGEGKVGTLFRMGAVMVILPAFSGGAGLLALFVIGKYNSLVASRNRYRNTFSQIEAHLKRGCDLIPSLVEIAKGYLEHERETLAAVVSARNSAYAAVVKAAANPGEPKAMRDLEVAEAGLQGALDRFFALAKAYPDVKADQKVLQLSEEWMSTEEQVSFAQRAYNDVVVAYNAQREMFPENLVARLFNFAAAELFQVQRGGERAMPKVSLT